MELGFKALEAANAEAIVKIIHGHENMVTHSKPMRLCVEKKHSNPMDMYVEKNSKPMRLKMETNIQSP